jgi:hypothetical protein
MTIIESLDRLDWLILGCSSDVTRMRNLITNIRERYETSQRDQKGLEEALAKLTQAHETEMAEHAALVMHLKAEARRTKMEMPNQPPMNPPSPNA